MAGVALAAGAGTRLAPITDTIPKPLCPVATVPLIDHALVRLESVAVECAVNVHHHAAAIAAHVGDRAHVSHEVDEALGTAGALAAMSAWLDGRPAVVVNGDTWCVGGLDRLVRGWDGETVRVLVPGGGSFGPRSPIVGTVLPWRTIAPLHRVPSGLYEVVWRHEHEAGRLEVIAYDGAWADCGTPSQLLDANLAALGGTSVVAPDAEVARGANVRSSAVSAGARVGEGARVERSVLFQGAAVAPLERVVGELRWVDASGEQRRLAP